MSLRYEIKVPFSKNLNDIFTYWINTRQNVKKHYPPRLVNNCYYDTPYFKSVFDNLDGISNREKYRIRWYNNNFNKANFEIKLKKSRLGLKITTPVSNFNFNNFFLSKKNFRKIDLKHFYEYVYSNHLKPVLLTKYIRRYFIYKNKIRVTIDEKIKYKDYKLSDKKFIEDNLNVLEIKFDNSDLNEINFLFNNFPFVAKRHSKYLRGLAVCNIASYI